MFRIKKFDKCMKKVFQKFQFLHVMCLNICCIKWLKNRPEIPYSLTKILKIQVRYANQRIPTIHYLVYDTPISVSYAKIRLDRTGDYPRWYKFRSAQAAQKIYILMCCQLVHDNLFCLPQTIGSSRNILITWTRLQIFGHT